MSSASSRDPFAGAPKELQMVDWPLRQRPLRTLLLLGGMVTAGLYAASTMSQPWLAVIALVLLLASIWRTWIPVRFELGPRGITERTLGRTRRIPWRDVARWEIHQRGVLLVADQEASAFSPLRGLYIHFPREPERLREVLDFYLGPRPRGLRKEDASGSISPTPNSTDSTPRSPEAAS